MFVTMKIVALILKVVDSPLPPDSIILVIHGQVLMKSCPLYSLKSDRPYLPSGVGDWIPNIYYYFSI